MRKRSEKDAFYQLKVVENKSKQEIIEALNLDINVYNYLNRTIKKDKITEITTESLERLVTNLLNHKQGDLKVISVATDIWKFKYKVPNEKRNEEMVDMKKMKKKVKEDGSPET